MKCFQTIIIIFILAEIKETEMVTLSNKQISVTLHDYKRSWHKARAICDNQGGRLYVEDSIERSIVLETFRKTWKKDFKEDVWIGLHYPYSGSNDTGAWTNCYLLSSHYIRFSPPEPSLTTSKRCVFSDADGWRTHNCHTKNIKFVCETSGDDCTFNRITGIPTQTSEFIPVTMTTVDKSACEGMCLSRIYNNTNCWGLNFDSSEDFGNCVLYFTTDPFYFTSTASYDSSTVSLSIKICYKDLLDQSKSDSSNGLDFSFCSQYMEQTTTTTTSTSATTTLAPTTTTTTPTTTTARTTTTTTAATTTTTSPAVPTTSTTTAATTTTTSPAVPTTATTTAATTTTTSPAVPTTATTTTATTTTATTAVPTTSTTTAATTTTTSPAVPTTATTTTATTTTTSPAVPTTATTTAATTTTTSPAVPTTATTTTATTTTTTPAVPTTTTTATTTTTTPAVPTTTTTATTTTTTPAVPTTSTTAAATTTTTTITASTPTTTTDSPSSSTTDAAPATTSTTVCNCKCSDLSKLLGNYTSDPNWKNMTTEEKVEHFITKLRVNKTSLSSFARKKTSARDDRVVSKSIGYIATSFMSVILGLLIVSDGINFWNYLTKQRTADYVSETRVEDSTL